MIDEKQLMDAAAQRIANGTDAPRSAPPKQQDLDDAVGALHDIKRIAALRSHDKTPRNQAYVAVTRSTTVNTDLAYATFLDKRQDVAQRSVAGGTMRTLIAIDGGLGSVEAAAALAQGGFVQVMTDENIGLDQAVTQFIQIFARTDLKSEICPGVTVGLAQVMLGETCRVVGALNSEALAQQQNSRRLQRKADAEVAAAQAAAAQEAQVARLKQTARSGHTLSAPSTPTATKSKKKGKKA